MAGIEQGGQPQLELVNKTRRELIKGGIIAGTGFAVFGVSLKDFGNTAKRIAEQSSVVVFWLMGSPPSGRQACRLLGKQRGEDIFCLLPTLEALVGIQDQCLNQRLRLLTTRFPNGFDGQAPLHR